MLEKFFFDSSALLAITRKEVRGPAVAALLDRIKPAQRITSVLVAYECYRGIPLSNARRKSQMQALGTLFGFFSLKSVFEAQAMAGARLSTQLGPSTRSWRRSVWRVDTPWSPSTPSTSSACLASGYST